ncbi:hypothetical protein BGZ61DRAFT_240069 [Ilyonectria robusta]|uniref:uncharacterized protein n=1 Tax=Ilyonectria robusta TaxID=1079257 RepID=UPI001E8DDABA|nr:uncharacterized protein BGZ61DRAFT_240069 [Ilyonectria robusta]KAH8699936.1 hypothetical protein BGZ61DRAFT_240069 [Ilyonectria robusta]
MLEGAPTIREFLFFNINSCYLLTILCLQANSHRERRLEAPVTSHRDSLCHSRDQFISKVVHGVLGDPEFGHGLGLLGWHLNCLSTWGALSSRAWN